MRTDELFEVMTVPITTSQVANHVISPGKKMRSNALLYAAFAIAWLGSGIVAFYLKRSELLVGFDGGYMRSLARRQFEWDLSSLSTSMDWFQGLGDVFFPLNFRTLPSFITASYFEATGAAKVAIYEMLLGELSLAVILLGLSLGATCAVSIAAALVTCATLLPFSAPTLIYPILPLIPQLGSIIAGALVAVAAFLRFGRRNWLADLPFALVVLALLVWSVLVSATAILLAAPFFTLSVVAGTIAAASPAERRRKIGLIAGGALILVTGPTIYLAGLVLDTAAVIFPSELQNNRATYYFASILFHWETVGKAGPILMVLGIAGAVLAAFDRIHCTLRVFAIALLIYLGASLTFAVLTIEFDFWRGPSPLYFEFFIIPLYAIFATLLCARQLQSIWRFLGWPLPHSPSLELGLAGIGIAIVLALALETPRIDYGFPYPPRSNQITDILTREIGLRPGSAFRGRAANMTGRSIDRHVDWPDLHNSDYHVNLAIGNELRLVGLHYFGIPGLFQYSPTISPFLYAVTTRLLALPGDLQTRNVLVLREIDPRILAMLGVRFVITDREYKGPASLRASVPITDRTLFLYEIAKPDLANYSPTAVSRIAKASDIVARLADPNFDPAREVIGDLPGDEKGLVPAHNARLSFDGGSLRLQAESDGRSVLLVPLEFSRCLGATPVEYEKPVLFRANLLETGVLFSGRMDTMLSLRTGPFLHPACRLLDFFDARALRVGEVPPRETRARPADD
jgi:hypothetical protein